MKIFILISLLFAISCEGEKFTLKGDTLFKGGARYTGERTFKKHKTIRTVNYLSGKRHGKATWFYENGNIARKAEYKEGRHHGIQQSFYKDGSKRRYAEYKNGKNHGDLITWYPNGQMEIYMKIVEGNEVGVKKWRDTGKIFSNYVVKNGKRIGIDGGKLCFTAKDVKYDL